MLTTDESPQMVHTMLPRKYQPVFPVLPFLDRTAGECIARQSPPVIVERWNFAHLLPPVFCASTRYFANR